MSGTHVHKLLFCSHFTQWLSLCHLLFLWQHCSFDNSPTALLKICTVSYPLPRHAHPVLLIQSTVPHSLSMHKMKYILTPVTLWCSCQVTMFLIGISNVTRLTMHVESSSGNIAPVVCNGSVGFSFMNMVDFSICSLVFTSYNGSLSYSSHPASISALLLQLTQNAKLVFHDNLGTAVTVCNTNVILAENSDFIHNQCAWVIYWYISVWYHYSQKQPDIYWEHYLPK